MKYIKKGSSPSEFEKWKKDNKTAVYNNVPVDIKEIVRHSLLEEQGYICCYCGARIEKEVTIIEHIKPKGLPEYSKHQLDYDNFLGSCNGGTDKRTKQRENGGDLKVIRKIPLHCDASKDNEIINITPLDENCENKFNYFEDGRITGNGSDAKNTIEILNLNNPILRNIRKNAFRAYNEDIEMIELLVDNSEEDLIIELLNDISCLDGTGKHKPYFYCALNYINSQLLNQEVIA